MTEEILDVAVVGGGVSGVYTAWRLLTDGGRGQVTVFEGGEEIGGRLLSVPAPNIAGMVAELGGMRILPAVQPRIGKLIEVLDAELPGSESIETYPFPVDEPQNLAYLRGEYLRLADFTADPQRVPYKLTFQEQGRTAGAIIVGAIEQVVPGITHPGLSEAARQAMAQEAEFAGEPLWKQGFWNVLLRVISDEAFQLALDAGGYDSTLSNWNAADAIPWFLSDFGVAPVYKGFTKGFQQVPLQLAELVQAAGGRVVTEQILDTFGWDAGTATFDLSFRGGATARTRTLVLAMPRRGLELIDAELLHAAGELIRSVTPRPLFKVFTTYSSPWWLNAGVQAGRTVTDLPVRQTYYWPNGDGSPATSGRAMLMASYDDGGNISFWDGLRPRRGAAWRAGVLRAEPPTAFLGQADIEGTDPRWRAHHAPLGMVREVERQLQQIHGLAFTPTVLDACFRDWGDDPFGGGWNNWNIGVRSWEVKERIIQPHADAHIPLYICGEAYSDAQGWVEGALQTADMLLGRLGVKPLA